MDNTSTTDVAAKMIGAQLQSLLKIPPIKKAPESDESSGPPGRHREEPPKYVVKKFEEKENSRRFETTNTDCIKRNLNVPPPSSDTVARDRFGRPFQSIDRRGRNRDFVNGPPKRLSGTNQREPPAPPEIRKDVVPRGPEAPLRSNYQLNSARDNPPKIGRQLQQDGGSHNSAPSLPPKRGPHPHPPPPHRDQSLVLPEPTPLGSKSAASTGRNSHEEEIVLNKPPPTNSTYNNEPQEPRRFYTELPDSTEHRVEPEVRRLVNHPDCPWDLRDKVDMLHISDDPFHSGNQDLAKILVRHSVIVIVRKNPKFPRAKFYCSACNYHMDTMVACMNHIMQDRHSFFEKIDKITQTLWAIPEPSLEHSSYLTDLLIKTSKLHGMNHTEHTQRFDIVRRISEGIKENNLDCTATLFGSSLSGFGFRDCNVNININVGTDVSPIPTETSSEKPSSPRSPTSLNCAEFSEITSKLLEIIKKLPNVSEHKVREVYTPKCVSIHFEEDKSRAPCVVHFNNTSAVLGAQLFAEYDKMDPRVKPLVLCFRHWARLCDLDDQDKGFLPPHCYTIMVIFYLQRKNILPRLHEIPKISNERPFATAEEAKRHWEPHERSGTESIGSLWLGLLKYYAVQFQYKSYIVSISRENCGSIRNEKQWNRKLCIEDPILPKSNLSRSVTNNKVCDYIIDRIKLTYLYFGIPREESGPLYEGILEGHVLDSEIIKFARESSIPTTSQALQRMVRQIQNVGSKKESKAGGDGETEWNINNPPVNKEVRMVNVCWKQETIRCVLREDVNKLHDILFKREHLYTFKYDNFSDGSLPPIICKTCGAEGHLRSNCPDETVPQYLPVEYPTPLTLARLDNAIALNYERESLNARDVEIRKRVLEEVKSVALPVFPNICLQLFGSTFNGFGMHSSDVDMCLTFSNKVVMPDQRGINLINVNYVLDKMVNTLNATGRMSDVIQIPSAKVPIVKFRHNAFRLDGDISLYNILSIHNTELLKLYTDLDSRVARLGLFLKKLVKICAVGDASKGSLSSYGYILMLIHFLQNHAVPVLPVLHELVDNTDRCRQKVHCDNHVVDYCRDFNMIPQLWDGYGKNKESVSQLWLAFLNYYVEMFDNEKYVVSISQSLPLTRASKCWYTEGLAIEDPFDKTHNLGLGLTRRMSVHILKTFQKYRMFFHQSTDHMRNDIKFLDYFVDVRNVRDGNPPIDRQCRLCFRIGHFARNCTYVKLEQPKTGNRKDEQNIRTGRRDEQGDEEDVVPVASQDTSVAAFANQEVPINNSLKLADGRDLLNSIIQREELVNVKFPVQHLQPVSKPMLVENSSHRIIGPAENGGILAQLQNGMPDFECNMRELFSSEKDIISQMKQPNENFLSAHLNNFGIYTQEDLETPKNDLQAPVKEVVFFGDIGSPNADGEQIQAMLRKNEGVTFTFDLAQGQVNPDSAEAINSLEISNTTGNLNMAQPPPGFCPPTGIYIGSGPTAHGLPYIPEQVPRAVIPTPPGQAFNVNMTPIGMQMQPSVPYGHSSPGMSIPFQSVIPVGAMQFDGRQQINGDSTEPLPVVGATAPPPGFAPLPTGNNNCIHPGEVLRNYPPPPYGIPSVSVYSIAPVGINYQPPSTYSSAPTASVENNDHSVVGYRQVDADGPTPPIGSINYDRNLMSATQTPSSNLIHQHQQQQPMSNLTHGFQQHVIAMNMGIPNGQVENGEEGSSNVYQKATSIAADSMFGSDYAGMLGGNPTGSSYGLSLSQAHHGPVVSALQMQHSQHHPMQMQGGHFHHPNYPNIRPFMPLGAYPGGPYSFPAAINVAHAVPHGTDTPLSNNNQHGEGGSSSLEMKHVKL